MPYFIDVRNAAVHARPSAPLEEHEALRMVNGVEDLFLHLGPGPSAR